MRVLFVDCTAGISGDMSVGAFLDLGVQPEYLITELNKLSVEGYRIHISKRRVRGITGTDFDVQLDKNIRSYWVEDPHAHRHDSGEAAAHGHHSHEDSDVAGHSGHIKNGTGDQGHHHGTVDHHTHTHTSWRQIRTLIEQSKLNENVKAIAIRIFKRLAEAESKVHGVALEEVHFHEVGAVDSIVDIVGLAICMDYIKTDWVVVSPLNTGSGTIQCRHGVLSVPAPATSEILASRKAIAYSSGIQGELVTPTGAAIACEISNDFAAMPLMKVDRIGYGTGKKDFGIPAVVKLVLGTVDQKVKDSLVTMEDPAETIGPKMDGFMMGKIEMA